MTRTLLQRKKKQLWTRAIFLNKKIAIASVLQRMGNSELFFFFSFGFICLFWTAKKGGVLKLHSFVFRRGRESVLLGGAHRERKNDNIFFLNE